MPTKEQTRDEVRIENQLVILQEKQRSLEQQNKVIQEDIDRKRTDYELYLGSRDAETKKLRNDIILERQKLDADKAEFAKILEGITAQKTVMEKENNELIKEKAFVDQTKENLRQCILSIQRAITLIGL